MRDALRHPGRRAGSQLGDERALLADVGHDPLGGVGRSRGAQVRHVVQQRMVVLVADRADDGRGRRGDRTHQAFVAEAEKGLRIPAAAGDDDDVDVGIRVEHLERGEGLGHAAIALHRGVHGAEAHLRPAQLGIAVHVLLSVGVLTRDQSDHVGEEGERLLAGRVEETLLAQLRAQPLEALELVAETDVLHRRHREAEVARLDEVVGLDRRDHVVADGEIGGDPRPHARPHPDRDLRVGAGVLEAREDVAGAHVPARDLALDPDRAPLRHEIADRGVQPRDRGRGVRGGLARRDGIGGRGLTGHGGCFEDGHRLPSVAMAFCRIPAGCQDAAGRIGA